MENIQFVPGQRWISNTESELGLGIVVENSGRLITLSFPAVGERRTYALDNAPVSRVIYSSGDVISSAEGLQLKVTDLIEQEGIITYIGEDDEGNNLRLEELDLDSFVQFSKPQDRLFAGQIDKLSRFQLRIETLHHFHWLQQSQVFGLLGARVQLLPHQLYIAKQVSARHAPRVLLADEVGLGKTIEAGLILHQLIHSHRADRVLIIVPDSLVHQWLVEMLRRFNLTFTILDEDRCQALESSEEGNPFESAQLVLSHLSFMLENPQRHAQALAADWDMLVVDEAHHLSWSEGQSSPVYDVVEALTQRAAGLLLLTATPEQLGVASHFARLRLLDPDRYHDIEKFHQEEQRYQRVNELIQILLDDEVETHLKNQNTIKQLIDFLGDEIVDQLDQSESLEIVVNQTIDRLLDQHGTGRVLFRNTRDVVEGFPQRQLNLCLLPELESHDDQAKPLSIEQWLKPAELFGENWLIEDSRVNWLQTLLAELRDEKILIICAEAETAQALEKHLRIKCGMRTAVFHEGLNLVARDRAAAYFADAEEGAQALICSEIGSEGRNFQFAHNLMLFDLPLNPDLLEQRIGRLDRIGQKNTVQIHVPCYANSAQHVLLRWYHEGLNAFEKVCPTGQTIYQKFRESLHDCLSEPVNDQAIEALINSTQSENANVIKALQQGRDRLLELRSCHPEHAQEIVEEVAASTTGSMLEKYMERVFDHYGVDQEEHGSQSILLHPGDHMSIHQFPGLPDDGMTATYQRAQAIVREDMHFLSWEHPMVTGAMDMIISGDFGNATFCTLKKTGLKPGTLILEAYFVVHCAAPRACQIQQYIAENLIRIVVDSNQRDLSETLSAEQFERRAERVPKRSAHDVIKHANDQINGLIKQATETASAQRDGIVAQALEKMDQYQSQEQQRLVELSKVNANIRADEIAFIDQLKDSLQNYLQGTQLKLDAIRVALTV